MTLIMKMGKFCWCLLANFGHFFCDKICPMAVRLEVIKSGLCDPNGNLEETGQNRPLAEINLTGGRASVHSCPEKNEENGRCAVTGGKCNPPPQRVTLLP